ncbi:hypothetical protein FRC19_007892 [Serendipita sp. 401]|nr:hypothetical protein FRC19_007892 [Serendipita sp. 401]
MGVITDLPEEILFEIISGYLNLSDTFHLLQTCKSLYKYVNAKALWLHVASCAHRLRPLPTSPDTWKRSTVDELRYLARRSLHLNDEFARKHVGGFREIYSLDVENIAASAGIMQPLDEVENAWLLLDGAHCITLSSEGIMILWHLESRQPLAFLSIEGRLACWDHQADNEGITVIANTFDGDSDDDGWNEEPPPTMFRVWRYSWTASSWTLVHEGRIIGSIESNYIHGNLAGCIGHKNEQYFIYAVDWTSQAAALLVVSGLKREYEAAPVRVSSLTSPTDLFFFMDFGYEGRYHSFPLDEIQNLLQIPMLQGQITPYSSQIHTYEEEQNEFAMRLMWTPRCRYLWDGRTGVFTRTCVGPSICKLMLLDVTAEKESSVKLPEEDGIGYTLRRARHVLRRRTDGMADEPGTGYLWTIGIFFKAMVWLDFGDDDDPEDQSEAKLCFAEFPSASQSTLDPPIDRHVQTTPPTLDVSDLLENGLLLPNAHQEFFRRLGKVVAPSEYGHICEHKLPSGWFETHEGVNSMDYDDARGRVAFVTGNRSKRLVIYEVV